MADVYPLDPVTRPFAAALILADADDETGDLPAFNVRLIEMLGPVDEIEDVHIAWAASCIAEVEGWHDDCARHYRVVQAADMLEAAQQATLWLRGAVGAEHWLQRCRPDGGQPQ